MAIVANKGNLDQGTDPSYCVHTRTNAGTPNGALTPDFVGEIIFDTTNEVRWQAKDKTNTSWAPLGPEVT